MKKQKTNINFPIIRFIIGGLLGGFIAYLQLIGKSSQYITPPFYYFILFLGVALIIGFIPMFIAFNYDKKHKEGISWLAFCAMFLPLGIILAVSSLIWAICDKPNITSKTKNTKSK